MVEVSEFLSAAEAAAQLRLSREQVIRRIQRGEIAGVFRDGKWLARLADVERVERARRATVPAAR